MSTEAGTSTAAAAGTAVTQHFVMADLDNKTTEENAGPVPKTMDEQEKDILLHQVSHDSDSDNDLHFRPVRPVNINVRNLSANIVVKQPVWQKFVGKHVDARTVKILQDVSADFSAGQLTALIGASGSGKTSMLNILSRRMQSTALSISGTIHFNNKPTIQDSSYAYVMQQDVLIPTLTVTETLTYAAELRLSSNTTKAERAAIVQEIVLELGLKECAHTRIGDDEHTGCSGGEKRRVSIGVQLLANPSVLFLDEPTTGLDATSAYLVVKTLKNLAMKGRTIITTIHQPRSEIWDLFDRVILLSRGRALYSGRQQDTLEHFATLGYHLPYHVNPADFLIDISAIDTTSDEAEQSSSERVRVLATTWGTQSANLMPPITPPSLEKQADELSQKQHAKDRKAVPFVRQVNVLTRRLITTTLRDPFGLMGSWIEAIFMGLLVGLVFLQLPKDYKGIRSREGAIYTASALQGYLVLLYETWRLSNVDIHVFDREYGEGVVSVLAFLVSRRLGKLLLEDATVPFLFSVIFYFMVGFDSSVSQFFMFFLIIFLAQLLAVTFATLCVAISRNFADASLYANLYFTLQSEACGYFIQISTMPVYMRWTRWTAYTYYAFGALSTNEFRNKFYDCPYQPSSRDNPDCIEYEGNFILKSLGFNDSWLSIPIGAMIGFVAFHYVVAGLLLQFLKIDINISKQRPNETPDRAAGKEIIRDPQDIEATKVDMLLHDIGLQVRNWNLLARKTLDKDILTKVNTKFEAGKLNVIMGPSGSGKSSLLNLIAQRLHSTPLSKYSTSGRILLSTTTPASTTQPGKQSVSVATPSLLHNLTTYVTQSDSALLASLTVRETLRFAAYLRLPKWLSKDDKRQRAEEVMVKLGLKDCADTVIGSEFLKGISGGEKRRVSVGVQVLVGGRILLLDEPTSGLDAFTAASILAVLRGLAEEGRTVICTIHQSRSDLYKEFGNVLLLARGGHAVYSGPAIDMLPYFGGLGYICPANTNPADFALDLVTVNLQQERKEAKSRAKVQALIETYQKSVQLPVPEQMRDITLPAQLGQLKRERVPFRVAYPVLVHRSFLNLIRQPPLVIARIMQATGLGIVLALFFSPLKNDYYSIQTRLGFVQQILPIYFVGLLNSMVIYPAERDVFYREHEDGAYHVEPFLLAYSTLEIPFEIITSLLFAVLTVIAPGLQDQTGGSETKMYFIVAYNAFCIMNCGESIGIMFNTLFKHTGFAFNLTSTILSVATLMAGIISLGIPSFLQAFNHLSPLKYAAANLLPYSLQGVKFTCDDAQRLETGQCPISSGEQVLEMYGYDNNAALNVLWLGIVAISYRLVAWGVVRAKRWRFGDSKEFFRFGGKEVKSET